MHFTAFPSLFAIKSNVYFLTHQYLVIHYRQSKRARPISIQTVLWIFPQEMKLWSYTLRTSAISERHVIERHLSDTWHMKFMFHFICLPPSFYSLFICIHIKYAVSWVIYFRILQSPLFKKCPFSTRSCPTLRLRKTQVQTIRAFRRNLGNEEKTHSTFSLIGKPFVFMIAVSYRFQSSRWISYIALYMVYYLRLYSWLVNLLIIYWQLACLIEDVDIIIAIGWFLAIYCYSKAQLKFWKLKPFNLKKTDIAKRL